MRPRPAHRPSLLLVLVLVLVLNGAVAAFRGLGGARGHAEVGRPRGIGRVGGHTAGRSRAGQRVVHSQTPAPIPPVVPRDAATAAAASIRAAGLECDLRPVDLRLMVRPSGSKCREGREGMEGKGWKGLTKMVAMARGRDKPSRLGGKTG